MWMTWVQSLGWEDSPGEEKGYPIQYSGLEDSMDCIIHGVTKSWIWLNDFHFPSLQIMVEIMKTMAIFFERSHAGTAILSAPSLAAGHCWSTPPLDTPGHSWARLGQSLVGSLLLSPGSWCTQGSICALQESISPVLCKFWQLYGGVNGDFLQEGLCHTQVWGTKPYPSLLHPELLPLQQSTAAPYLYWRHSNTQCLSLSGVFGSWCTQGLFEPFQHLW